MSKEIFESVANELDQQRRNAEAAFQDLAEQIADEQQPAPGRVPSVLSATGKSLDDLRAAVDAIERRRREEQHWESLQPVLERAKEAKARIERANADLASAQELHRQIVAEWQPAVEAGRQAEHAFKHRAR